MSKKRFAIRRSRPGLGQGLYATKEFRKGDFVVEYTGKKITNAYADTLTTRYLFELDKKWTIDGSPRTNIARYINHSCDPNCEAEIDGDRVFVYAKRRIHEGEELTFDYGKEYFEEFIKPKGCRCDACTGMSLGREKA